MGEVLSICLHQGWLPIQQQINCSGLPSFELFLAREDTVFVLQCVSCCLLFFSDISTSLLDCSFKKSEDYFSEAVNLNIRDKKQLCRISSVQAYSGLVKLAQVCVSTLTSL